jgi:uncharacterized membrane protein YoaK (UPF0700 family)
MPSEPTPAKPPFLSTPLDLLLLTMAAGSADAAGYLGLGKIFTANMTGNIVLLGIALSQNRNADTGRTLLSLFTFVAGTCLGGWICRNVTRKEHWPAQVTRVIACEAVLLLAYALLWFAIAPRQSTYSVYPLIALLGVCMGLQSAAATFLGIPGVVTTVVTGTLTSLLTGVMKVLNLGPRLESETDKPASPLGLQALVVITYCLGGAASGLIMLHARSWAGFIPASIVLLVVLTRLGRR